MQAKSAQPRFSQEIYKTFTRGGAIHDMIEKEKLALNSILMEEQALIDIQNVSRRYGSVQALKNVNLRVQKGSVLGLLGQNGAGKTTLLNILTGYLAPTEGRALIGGYDTLMEPAQARRHLGYLPEQPPLYDEMTVQEYLRFAAELRGVEKRAIPAHVDEVMALTGLVDMRSRMIGHLS